MENMTMKERIKKYCKENYIFLLFFLVMTVCYGYDMFHRKPWYDELYTYYSFISRGPVYAAIHWPVPNNHVLYSVLSAFLDFFGNSFIGLRGVSFLASLANLWLLYELGKKILSRTLSCGCVMLYAAAYQIHNLSVQGRGYTLTITFYLIALHCLYQICQKKEKRFHYFLFALALTGGLYTIVSSTFWVIPVCFVGGFYLLFYKKDYKTLGKLILTAVLAACMTLFLYSVIWLAIGSNLLCKNPDSIYYGIYQIDIILQAPLKALRTGMEYMLATPYIQGDARSFIIAEMFHYLTGVFQLHFSGMGEFLTVFLGIGTLITGIYFVKKGRKDDSQAFFCIYLLTSAVMLPLMLIIQSVQPYFRVFSFFSVPLTFLFVYLLQQLLTCVKEKKSFHRLELICFGFMAAFSCVTLCRKDYHCQYAGRENEIAEIMETSAEGMESVCYGDDFQKYVLKFYYDVEPAEAVLGEAQYFLLPKEVLKEDYIIPQWPVLYGHEAIDFHRLEKEYILKNESESYYLYIHCPLELDNE